ncbi:hypothetical protein E4K10_42640 [Streptomyces sp. T1317-0309]|nr:hypothetical protein E4K10_42640 [Streptomyces sp. T1317-0309]
MCADGPARRAGGRPAGAVGLSHRAGRHRLDHHGRARGPAPRPAPARSARSGTGTRPRSTSGSRPGSARPGPVRLSADAQDHGVRTVRQTPAALGAGAEKKAEKEKKGGGQGSPARSRIRRGRRRAGGRWG